MSKILTAYFSASGNTKRLAETIAKAAGADLFEIASLIPYTNDDLNWMNKKSRSSIEMNDKSSRPEMVGNVGNMEQYDTVLIGFPIWWYEAPRIIQSFLESYDFSGKTIVTFATSGGSGMGKTNDILKRSCSPDTKLCAGKRMNSNTDINIIKSWLGSLNI